ncbi:MAG: phosphoadenylyl-sulfate reductase [Gammaproteobacteria bacterium]|mgnify:FL=1|jgi:phosphoadenosine phosphosulfate reductase|nr:phosphoadenylyl-sulfate reductase [Gammaproteobacteria bacterium]
MTVGAAQIRISEGGRPKADLTDLARLNQVFTELTAEQRIRYALDHFAGPQILTSSFGAQSAVSLHLLTQQQPDMPVVLIDTGYLFDETYQFIETLQSRLGLNLVIYRSEKSPAWQEALYGQRWLQGLDGLDAYNYDNKVEPMQRALQDLNVATWFSGVRRIQSSSRVNTPFVQFNGDYYKVAPLADWHDKHVFDYLKAHDLPYHPLWEKGYVSIGDVHTTRSLNQVESVEQTRFFGLKRECGLHDTL